MAVETADAATQLLAAIHQLHRVTRTCSDATVKRIEIDAERWSGFRDSIFLSPSIQQYLVGGRGIAVGGSEFEFNGITFAKSRDK
jgi:hypothetical protein